MTRRTTTATQGVVRRSPTFERNHRVRSGTAPMESIAKEIRDPDIRRRGKQVGAPEKHLNVLGES
jgi:hypothetical protein